MYDANLDQWKRGPTLNYKRRDHSCATVKDMNGNFANVIAAGGERVKSVEILNIASSKWENGPDLPKPIEESALVASDPHDTSVIAYLIAGQDGDSALAEIYSLPRSLTSWQLVGHLAKKRLWHVALSVTSDILPGCTTLKGMHK